MEPLGRDHRADGIGRALPFPHALVLLHKLSLYGSDSDSWFPGRGTEAARRHRSFSSRLAAAPRLSTLTCLAGKQSTHSSQLYTQRRSALNYAITKTARARSTVMDPNQVGPLSEIAWAKLRRLRPTVEAAFQPRIFTYKRLMGGMAWCRSIENNSRGGSANPSPMPSPSRVAAAVRTAKLLQPS